jgi:methionine-R-sulfoxide reductase
MDLDKRKQELSDLEREVTQNKGTEAPFTGELLNNKEKGMYVCKVCGQNLFSFDAKFDSGTGWPSFTKPIEGQSVVEKEDRSLFMKRIEVRSKKGDSHLGHLFDDGPKAQGGLRYCINSASLRFIPVENLDGEGYGQYKKLFK